MMDNTGKDSPLLQHVKNIPISSKLAVIWIQIKMFSRELKFRWQTLNSPKQTPHGFVFWGNRHVVNGTFEPQETKIFNSLLPYVEEVINVGANVGYYCCHALGKNKLVTAFEPDPLNIRYLLSNIRANGWSHNFELFPFCLGEKRGILSIFGHGTGTSLLKGWANTPEAHSNLTFVNTADSLLASRDSGKKLFMIDIEGAEFSFLKGAKVLLGSKEKHYWIIEVNLLNHFPGSKMNPNFLETMDVFLNENYKIWSIGQKLKPISRELIISAINDQEDHLGSHNFLFLPESESDLLLSKINF